MERIFFCLECIHTNAGIVRKYYWGGTILGYICMRELCMKIVSSVHKLAGILLCRYRILGLFCILPDIFGSKHWTAQTAYILYIVHLQQKCRLRKYKFWKYRNIWYCFGRRLHIFWRTRDILFLQDMVYNVYHTFCMCLGRKSKCFRWWSSFKYANSRDIDSS
jgi:hypothetical protein